MLPSYLPPWQSAAANNRLRYLYLIFADDNVASLDEWVFTTGEFPKKPRYGTSPVTSALSKFRVLLRPEMSPPELVLILVLEAHPLRIHE